MRAIIDQDVIDLSLRAHCTAGNNFDLNYKSTDIDIAREARFLAFWDYGFGRFEIAGNSVSITVDGYLITSGDVYRILEE